MQTLSTTRMSSKGQVVIPENVRIKMGLTVGDQFVVVGDGDVVILKTIRQPSMSEFDGMIQVARRQARSSGMKLADIKHGIRRARNQRAISK